MRTSVKSIMSIRSPIKREDACRIELSGITKRYSGRHINAVASVSLTFEEGELIAILGPSGCGKSTLLNIIGGVDRPSEGSVTIGGVDLSVLSDDELTGIRRFDLGFIFQFFNLMPTFTVYENVSLPLEISGLLTAEKKKEVGDLLDFIGLANQKNSLPAQLSGGEMQRVAIARAIVHNPRIVLADEPTGNLDTENGSKILSMLKEINQSKGITVVMATHSMEAASYATRVIRMRDGKVESDEKA